MKIPKVGDEIYVYDHDEEKYVKSLVLKIENDKVYLKDANQFSDWEGLKWDEPLNELHYFLRALYQELNQQMLLINLDHKSFHHQ